MKAILFWLVLSVVDAVMLSFAWGRGPVVIVPLVALGMSIFYLLGTIGRRQWEGLGEQDNP